LGTRLKVVRDSPPRRGDEEAHHDDDFGQAGTMVREVLDDDARDRLAHNVIGLVSKGLLEPVLSGVFEYWKVDPDLGKKIEEGVRANLA
jgi:catalase